MLSIFESKRAFTQKACEALYVYYITNAFWNAFQSGKRSYRLCGTALPMHAQCQMVPTSCPNKNGGTTPQAKHNAEACSLRNDSMLYSRIVINHNQYWSSRTTFKAGLVSLIGCRFVPSLQTSTNSKNFSSPSLAVWISVPTPILYSSSSYNLA